MNSKLDNKMNIFEECITQDSIFNEKYLFRIYYLLKTLLNILYLVLVGVQVENSWHTQME